MKTWKVSRMQMFALLIAATANLVACINTALIPVDAPPTDPLSMVAVFHQTVNSEDVDALIALFADDAVVVDNGFVIEGKQQIQNWVLHSQRMSGLRLTMLNSEMDGEKVLWFDEAYKEQGTGHDSYLLRWEAIISEGKIQSLAAMPRYWPDQKYRKETPCP